MNSPHTTDYPGGSVHEPGLHSWRFQDRDYLAFVPAGPVVGLIVAFHPFGASPELVINGELAGSYLICELEGLRRPAQARGFVVLSPRSMGRIIPGRLAGLGAASRRRLATGSSCAGRFRARPHPFRWPVDGRDGGALVRGVAPG